MSSLPCYETTNLCASDLGRRARVPGGRLAFVGCFRPPPVPNTSRQRPGENAYQIARSLGCNPQTARNAIHLFNDSGLQAGDQETGADAPSLAGRECCYPVGRLLRGLHKTGRGGPRVRDTPG